MRIPFKYRLAGVVIIGPDARTFDPGSNPGWKMDVYPLCVVHVRGKGGRPLSSPLQIVIRTNSATRPPPPS